MATVPESDPYRVFPFLHALRAVGIALEPRKLLLGGAGLLILAAGTWLLAHLPFAPPDEPVLSSHDWPAARLLEADIDAVTVLPEYKPLPLLYSPVESVIDPALPLFENGNSMASIAWAVTMLLWSLSVWSIFGGALCRMAAMQFARKPRVSIRQAVTFSVKQYQSYMIAPLLPLGGILCLLAVNALLGLVGTAASVLTPLLGLLWCLVLFLGFLMTVMLIGTAAGWPLMIAAISTEDSDGFDGLCRAYGFLTDRPWYALVLLLVTAVAGHVGWFFLQFLIDTVTHLSGWSVSSLMLETHGLEAAFFGDLSGVSDSGERFVGAPKGASVLIGIWTSLLVLLLVGYGPSFFWSGSTAIYMLLRRSDDGTPLDDVADFRIEAQPQTESEPQPESEDESGSQTVEEEGT